MKQGNQRIKGATFERKITNILKTIWPEARRGIQYRDGGKEASDVVGTPYHIECSKGGESIWAKWKQANQDAKHNLLQYVGVRTHDIFQEFKEPVVIKQRDREAPVVMLSLSEWLKLIRCKQEFDTKVAYAYDLKFDEAYRKEFGTL
jgi:hypothetical protein